MAFGVGFPAEISEKKTHLKPVKQVDITVVRHSVRAIGQVGSASVLGA